MKELMIKDEIHGIITFNELEKKIIDSPHFQRLRRIKQMAVAYLVYPGANHTRFEHCLGTCYLAGEMAKALGLDSEEVEKARLYGLVHDIGHTPFSHDGEEVVKEIIGDHEEIGRRLIENSELKDIIEERFQLKEILEFKFKSIVESDVGADRIDYLLRDSKNTGVAYGVIDSDRIIRKTVIEKGELMIEEKALEAAEYLLIARFMMFSAVYLHKTVRIATGMLQKAIREALEEGLDAGEFAKMGDEEALLEMKKYEKSRELVERLMDRRLYKEYWRGKEEAVERVLKNIKGDYIIHGPTKMYKFISIKVKTREGVKRIYEISPLLKSIKEASEEKSNLLVAVRED